MEKRKLAFLLYVFSRGDDLGIELRQRLNSSTGDEERPVVRAWGRPLQVALSQVFQALRTSGYRPSDLHRGRSAPFELKEEAGVRLGLLLLALKPLRKTSRMERIAETVGQMPDEEVYYWFSKVTGSTKAQRALRILADEGVGGRWS